jgi:hypothetical protein
MKYARIHNDAVVEICTPIDGFTVEECFHIDLVDKMIPCGDDVQPGWTVVDGVLKAPVVVETVETAAE